MDLEDLLLVFEIFIFGVVIFSTIILIQDLENQVKEDVRVNNISEDNNSFVFYDCRKIVCPKHNMSCYVEDD